MERHDAKGFRVRTVHWVLWAFVVGTMALADFLTAAPRPTQPGPASSEAPRPVAAKFR